MKMNVLLGFGLSHQFICTASGRYICICLFFVWSREVQDGYDGKINM